MAQNNPSPPIAANPAFLPVQNTRFADNEFQNITERTFRDFAADIDKHFVDVDKLNTNMVRGSVFRVPYVEMLAGLESIPTALIPPRFRILEMEARAVNGVDAATAGTGVRAAAIDFRLIADPLGPVVALVDEQPATTATVRCRWVRTSGSDAQKQAYFDELVLEDHDYLKGEVVKYTSAGKSRLVEWRADSVGFSHPLPTGQDDDPIYAPYSVDPPAGSFQALTGSLYDNAQAAQELAEYATTAYVDEHSSPWVSVGDPADLNVSLGPLTGATFLGTAYRNSFGGEHYGGLVYGTGLYGNTFGGGQENNTYGQSFQQNRIGNEVYNCSFGEFVSYCRLWGNNTEITVGDHCSDCQIGASVSRVTLGAGCERVEVYGATPVGTTLTIPAGTTDAVYREGVLVVAATGGGSATATTLQIRSDNTNRVLTLRPTERITLLAVAALAANNCSAATFQFNTYKSGAWAGGVERTAIADAQADESALTDADFAAGVELLIRTLPITATDPAYLLLDLNYGS